jgi:hypothetical protein
VIGFSSGNKIATGDATTASNSTAGTASPTPAVVSRQTNRNSAAQRNTDSVALKDKKVDKNNTRREQKPANNSRMPLR